MKRFLYGFGLTAVLWLAGAVLLNLAFFGAAVWVVVWVLKSTGVL